MNSDPGGPERGAKGRPPDLGDDLEELDDGRYLYCVVDAAAVDSDAFDAAGLDGRDPYVIEVDDVGAVVQEADGPHRADDPTAVRKWLLAHQSVVDVATETFGTPLPMRFDTLVDGGDEAVRDWLADERESLRAALDRMAGFREYRVQLVWTDPPDPADEGVEEFVDLRDRIDDADEGRAFLLEKQYDQRAGRWRRSRKGEIAAELRERLAPFAAEFEPLGEPDTGGGIGGSDAAGESAAGRETGGGAQAVSSTGVGDEETPIARVALLATEDDEGPIGDELGTLADRPGVTVRFTGPWAPYTFAPDL